MTEKKILCLINNLGAGGAQRQMVGLAKSLKNRGYDVTLAFYDNNTFYLELLQSQDIKTIYLQELGNPKTRLFKYLRYVKKERPDVVVSYLDTPNICSCFAKIFYRKTLVIVSERSHTVHLGIKERIRFNLYRWADHIVPNSYAQADFIRNSFPFLSPKVTTISNFVDLQHFSPPQEKKRQVVPEIVVVASVLPYKNTKGFIEAVAKLKDKGCRFHVSWYGLTKERPDYINDCRDMIKCLHVEDYINLKEKTTQIRDHYQDADYFCLPSFFEGTPNVICEAMACGLPVACSDVCDNSIYVKEGENGSLFNPYDTNSIVTAVGNLLLLSDDKYGAFCRNSRAVAESKMSIESFVESYIKIIEQ